MVVGKTAILIELVDTIIKLKEPGGSAPDKILNHLVAQRKTPLRNAAHQVKLALKNGLKSGVIKEVRGKFKLGLAQKAYALIRRHISVPVKQLRKRRGKKRSNSRRRHGRRRKRTDCVDSENLATGNDESGSELMDRGRRRKGRSRRRKGRSRRGRRRSYGPEDDVDSVSSTESNEVSDKSSDEKPKTEKKEQGREGTGLGTSEPEKREIGDSELMDIGRRRKGHSRSRKGRRRCGRRSSYGLKDEVGSVRSTEWKEVPSTSADKKPKAAKGQGRRNTEFGITESEKREIVFADSPRRQIDQQENIRSYLHQHIYDHDVPYSHHPPPHYDKQYYD